VRIMRPMTDQTSSCPDCSTLYELDDNYCRQCGMYLPAMRALPAVAPAREARALEATRPGLPAPVTRMATAIAVGTALQIGLGIAGKLLANQAANKAVSASLKPRGKQKSQRAQTPARRDEDPVGGAAAVSETLIIRRVWIRRD
jgi:hypothetical protein